MEGKSKACGQRVGVAPGPPWKPAMGRQAERVDDWGGEAVKGGQLRPIYIYIYIYIYIIQDCTAEKANAWGWGGCAALVDTAGGFRISTNREVNTQHASISIPKVFGLARAHSTEQECA